MHGWLIASGILLGSGVALAGGRFDGLYVGHILANETTTICHRDAAPARWEVVDDRFSVRWRGNKIDVAVQPDGSFSEYRQLGGGAYANPSELYHIEGRIAGSQVRASAGSRWCTIHYALVKGGA